MFRFNNDQVSAGVWFTSGMIIAIASIHYGLGSLDTPGTGFISFLSGLAICLFSFVGLVQSTLKQKQGGRWESLMEGARWGKALIVLGALFGYALMLDRLGFIACTTLFFGFLLKTVKPQKWLLVIAGSIFVALGSYVFFGLLLETQLPKGPWGF